MPALTRQAMKRKVNALFKNWILNGRNFTPRVAARDTANWLLSLRLTDTEKSIAKSMLDEILLDYNWRLKSAVNELNDVFRKTGG